MIAHFHLILKSASSDYMFVKIFLGFVSIICFPQITHASILPSFFTSQIFKNTLKFYFVNEKCNSCNELFKSLYWLQSLSWSLGRFLIYEFSALVYQSVTHKVTYLEDIVFEVVEGCLETPGVPAANFLLSPSSGEGIPDPSDPAQPSLLPGEAVGSGTEWKEGHLLKSDRTGAAWWQLLVTGPTCSQKVECSKEVGQGTGRGPGGCMQKVGGATTL